MSGSRRFAWVAVSSVLALASACASLNRLSEYEFAGRTLAAAYDVPPYPEVLTAPLFFVDTSDPIRAILEVGSRIATEVQAHEARQKLDEATDLVDLGGRMADRSLARSSRSLGASVVEELDLADYVLEVNIREYGIDAEGWDAATHFFVDAQVYLIEGPTGRGIWESRVEERDAITPAMIGLGSGVRDVVTAGVLASLSVEEIAHALERLADYSADRIADRLRDDLEDVR